MHQPHGLVPDLLMLTICNKMMTKRLLVNQFSNNWQNLRTCRRRGFSTADKRKMGELRAQPWVIALAVLTAATVIALNIKLLIDFVLG